MMASYTKLSMRRARMGLPFYAVGRFEEPGSRIVVGGALNITSCFVARRFAKDG